MKIRKLGTTFLNWIKSQRNNSLRRENKMKSEFSFNEVSLSDIEKYANSSNVFNLSEDDILKEVITLASFHDENLGSSEEKLDLAIYNNKEWKLLDIEDKIGDNNQIPLSYLIKDI